MDSGSVNALNLVRTSNTKSMWRPRNILIGAAILGVVASACACNEYYYGEEGFDRSRKRDAQRAGDQMNKMRVRIRNGCHKDARSISVNIGLFDLNDLTSLGWDPKFRSVRVWVPAGRTLLLKGTPNIEDTTMTQSMVCRGPLKGVCYNLDWEVMSLSVSHIM